MRRWVVVGGAAFAMSAVAFSGCAGPTEGQRASDAGAKMHDDWVEHKDVVVKRVG